MEKKKKSEIKSVVFTGLHDAEQIKELTGMQGSYTQNPLQYRFGTHVLNLGDEVVSTDGKITIKKKKTK